jgi:hypothetical protein
VLSSPCIRSLRLRASRNRETVHGPIPSVMHSTFRLVEPKSIGTRAIVQHSVLGPHRTETAAWGRPAGPPPGADHMHVQSRAKQTPRHGPRVGPPISVVGVRGRSRRRRPAPIGQLNCQPRSTLRTTRANSGFWAGRLCPLVVDSGLC